MKHDTVGSTYSEAYNKEEYKVQTVADIDALVESRDRQYVSLARTTLMKIP
jgi:hypothetical protein